MMIGVSFTWTMLLVTFSQRSFVAALTKNVTTSGNTESGLVWNQLSVMADDGHVLLAEFDGSIANGRVCGLLGPSGAGKSTTLSALGGVIASQSGLVASGDVFYYNATSNCAEPLTVSGGRVAWMQQNDHFFEMLTVKETLTIASFLELPTLDTEQRNLRVLSSMESLGLIKLADRRIGDSSLNKGLSGGERRRLSLALELIASPKLFIGDEPTSGLDSNLSEKVIQLIKKLVQERDIPCILSLHQPRSSIWRMLDSVVLMASAGRVCYMGPTQDAVRYFKRLGYQCPSETNPAEFLLDLVSVDSEDPVVAEADETRIAHLVESFRVWQESQKTGSNKKGPHEQCNMSISQRDSNKSAEKRAIMRPIGRLGRLLLRSLRQNCRNHRVNALRFVASAGNALLFTTIFKSIKKELFTAKSIADRAALLTFGTINMSMMALMKTIDLFAKEKPVVRREQQRKQYTSLEYLASKSLAEIPLDSLFAVIFAAVLKSTSGIRIGWRRLMGTFALMTVSGASMGFAIGSLSPTAEIAMSAGVPLMVILMTVGVINPSGVDTSEPPPIVVQILKRLSPISHTVRALCMAEFSGAEFDVEKTNKGFFGERRAALRDLPKMGALALVKNGDQVLHELGLGDDSYGNAIKRLGILSVANLLLSWIGLKASQR